MVLLAAGSVQADYVVQPGDTCAALARKFFPDDPSRLDQLHAVNPQLGPPPHHLQPGSKLRVTANPDATITFFKPMVQRKPRAAPQWEEVSQGENLFRLDSVTTLAGAGAEVTFREQDKLRMDENALIVIYGGTPLKDAAANRSGAIELVQGDLALRLAEMRGETMQVRTPGALVAGSMRSGRVGVDADKMSRVSVFEGDAKVSASGKAVAVHQGFGTRVAKGKPPEPPEPLPPAPAWVGDSPGPRILVGAATAQQTLTWEPGAPASRLQVSHDLSFNDLISDDKLSSPSKTVSLAPGRYFARVWAINGKGMAGPPGVVWTLDVLAVKAEGAAPAEGGLRGPGPVKLNLDAPAGAPVFLDGKALTSGTVTVSEPGKHELTSGSAKLSIEIVPPPPPAPPPVVVAPPPPPPPPPRPPPALTSYFQSRVAGGPLTDPWRDTRPELELSLQSISNHGASGLVRAGGSFEALRLWAQAGLVNGDDTHGSGRFAGVGAMVWLHPGEIFSGGLGAEFNGPISGGADPLLRSNLRILATAGARVDRFAISTTQAGVTAGVTGWNGNLAASFRLADDFFAQASLEGATLRTSAFDDKGGAVAAGLRYGDGAFDLTLAGRAGLYDGGRDLWSKGSVLLSLRWSGLGLPEQPAKKHKWVPPY